MHIRQGEPHDAKGIAKVQVDSWRTTYKGIVPDSFLKNLSYDSREKIWSQVISQGHLFVAETKDGEIVGFACGGKERSGNYSGYDGELYAIYLLEEYQGKGIGTALVQRIKQYLIDNNYHSMVIFALEENPACRFYEAIGGKLIGKEEIEIGGKPLLEVVYGWTEMNK